MSGAARVAVVTGAASGIGLGIAQRFAADGHKVAVLDRNAEAAAKAASELVASGATAISVAVDVADHDSVVAAFGQVRNELGNTEILVTSAGIEGFDSLLDVSPQRWEQIIAVNLTGTFWCVQEAVPQMIDAGFGRIVTISSSSALSGARRMTHYVASKGGVIGLTKALAAELAPQRITANSIAPCLIDTPMVDQAVESGDFPGVEAVAPHIPLGRAGTPDDTAAAAAYLASDGAEYITGQTLTVAGGLYL
ncbi:MAG: SDR family oxidoreductase [Microthrixaceae bacterium]|nr:SDR family oxidoreductase [Microthrixaceae bacterium]